MKKLAAILSVLTLIVMVSCTKSGGLTGGASGSASTPSNGSISGTVSGGLSPVAGATVTLLSGGGTQLGSATTSSSGTFTIVYTAPASNSLLYLLVTGGNTTGNAVNAKNQFLSIAGASAAPSSSVSVNEVTTSAAMALAANFNLISDTNGTVTLTAPPNSATLANVITQWNNLITSGNLNTSGAGMTTSIQNALYTASNGLASCVEQPSTCSTLFTTAVTSAGAAAVNMLDSMNNMLFNGSTLATPIYNFGNSLSATTGFTPSSRPSTLSTPMPAVTSIITGPAGVEGVTIDTSGNLWAGGSTTVAKINPATGGTIASVTPGGSCTSTNSLAADANGNIWVACGTSTMLQLSSAAVVLQTITTSSSASFGVAFDPSGNLWLTHENSSGTVDKISASGTVLGTFATGSSPTGVVLDASGNAYVTNLSDNTITKLNSSGANLGTFALPGCSLPLTSVIDSSGNLWTGCLGNNKLLQLSSTGTLLQTVSGFINYDMIIDSAGNLWGTTTSTGNVNVANSAGKIISTYVSPVSGVAGYGLTADVSGNLYVSDHNNARVVKYSGIAAGPEFIPYNTGLPSLGSKY